MTIFKYKVELEDHFYLMLPKFAEVLTVQTQNDEPFIWCLVNPENEPTRRGFYIVGTGHPINECAGKYVGTFQLHGGRLVFHLFEEQA